MKLKDFIEMVEKLKTLDPDTPIVGVMTGLRNPGTEEGDRRLRENSQGGFK